MGMAYLRRLGAQAEDQWYGIPGCAILIVSPVWFFFFFSIGQYFSAYIPGTLVGSGKNGLV
jgi:hypothetical protein